MTDKEKEKLLNAFEIPDPDRKKQFAAEFRKRTPEKVKKPLFPVITKAVASAAMLALVIAAITRLPKHNPDEYKDTVIATTVEASSDNTSSQTNDNNSIAVTTTTVSGKKVTTTTTVSDDKTNTDTRTTTTEKIPDENDDDTTSPRETTRAVRTTRNNELTTPRTTKTTSVKTTSHHEAVRTTATTNKHEEIPNVTTVTTTVAAPTFEKSTGRDMTVDIDVEYDIRSEILTVKDLMPESDSSDGNQSNNGSPVVGAPAEQIIKQMFDYSNAVILAKVDKIVYTSIYGEAYTAENITVEEVFKGSLRTDDTITLFVSGGYMSAEDYIKNHKHIFLPEAENYSIFDDGGCMGKEYVGETYLFFIKKTESGEFPHGSYELIYFGDEAIFRCSGDSYVSMHDDTLSLDISSLY